MTASDDYTPVLHRPMRKPIVPCGCLLFGIIAPIVYMVVSSHLRTQVVGKVDPSTGFRIVYSVSSRYRVMDGNEPQTLKAAHELEYWAYMPVIRSTPMRLFYTLILRRPDAATEPEA